MLFHFVSEGFLCFVVVVVVGVVVVVQNIKITIHRTEY